MPDLRPYQFASIESCREHVRQGRRRILLVMPTGAGKTVTFGAIAKSARENFDARILFIVHRIELIDQAVRQLEKAGLVEVGVIRADDARTNPSMPIQVATIQTLGRRSPPPADIVFIDESHRAASESYARIMALYPEATIIGLTATPCRADGKPLGEHFDVLENVVGYSRLILEGHIVAPRCFGSEHLPDLSKVKTVAGDYDIGGLEDAMCGAHVLGDTIAEWQARAEGRRTVVFAVTVAHSRAIAQRFADIGVRVAHVDANTPDDERVDVSRRLRAGELDVVSNVGIYCLDDQTEILTSAGWVGIDGMNLDHRVANWDSGTVTFERPSEIVRRARAPGEWMVVLDSPRINVRVTESHRMLYRTTADGSFLKCQASDLVGRVVKLPVSGRAEPEIISVPTPERVSSRKKAISHTAYSLRKLNGYSWDNSFVEAERRVDRLRALRHKSPHELSLDECGLIGFWIGDGSVSPGANGGVHYTLSQPESKPKIVTWIDHTLSLCGIDSVRSGPRPAKIVNGVTWKRGYRWSLSRGAGGGPQEREGVFPIEPYLQKSGTALLWGLSESQFDALLHGLWMANGDHLDGSEPGSVRARKFYSANVPLLELLQAIASVRGYRAKVVRRGPGYQLTLLKTDDFHIGTCRFRLENGWREERVWCVKTRTKNIITRRRGTVTVTGNTEGWDEPSVKCIILARPTKSLSLYMQMCGRGLRPWNEFVPSGRSWLPEDGPSIDPVLIDQGGNIDRHGSPHADRKWSLTTAAEMTEKKPACCVKCRAYIKHYPCPECGYAPPVSPREVVEKPEAKLGERAFVDPMRVLFDKSLKEAQKKGFKPGFASFKVKEAFGDWPPWAWSQAVKAAYAADEDWQERVAQRALDRERWQAATKPVEATPEPDQALPPYQDDSEIPFIHCAPDELGVKRVRRWERW
jgi:superfamily II DNA or RNA helicase